MSFVADQGDLVDRRAFGHGDHQDVALTLQLHVLEEAGLEQCPDGFGALGLVHAVALSSGR